MALKNVHGNNLTLVFGCGGDRDFKKRPLMGKIAFSNCKKIYVTDDNPRSENPKKIRAEIINNIKSRNLFNIGNRSKAIENSILNADPNEIILVAGKGHEKEQIYKNKTIQISDKQIIKRLKIKNKRLSTEDQNFKQNEIILRDMKNIKINKFNGFSIDSRSVKKNNLFLTLKGKKYHGSKFITQALQKGAKFIITSKKTNKYKNKTILVKNEAEFLKILLQKNEILLEQRLLLSQVVPVKLHLRI